MNRGSAAYVEGIDSDIIAGRAWDWTEVIVIGCPDGIHVADQPGLEVSIEGV